MRQSNNRTEAKFAKLDAAYQAAWRHFSVAVSRRQSLQTEDATDANAISDAEMAAESAESQYRQARNALAEYILESSSKDALVGSR
jgi:hypothetical protein